MIDLAQLGKMIAGVGAPILGAAIGGPAGALATTAIKELANALAVEATPDAIAREIAKDQDRVSEAARAMEERMFNVWDAEATHLAANRKTEGEWTMFKDGWRSGLCWSLIVMWLFGLILVPVLNGFGFKVSSVPIDSLLAFSTVVLTILGGGHTLKAVLGKRAA